MFSAVIFDIHAGERSERDGKAQQRRAVSAQPRDSRPYLGIMPKIFFLIRVLSSQPCTVTVWVLGHARIHRCL